MHMGGKKSSLRAILFDTSSDVCNSPGAKTPNVVARLMGLDLLPDNLDLIRSSRNSVRAHRDSGNSSGTRSLPVSPRMSSARKSDSDIHRLSLQLNRENKHEEFGSWRLKELKQDEESPIPRQKGRQLTQHVKEKVITRRLGMDITNLLENRRAGKAQNQTEHRKVRSISSQKENTISPSPTFVFKQDKISQQLTKLTLSKDSKKNLKSVNEQPLRPINGWKKADSESKFSLHSTPINRNKQRRAFISTPSAVSPTGRPLKQMKRAEEPERNADATTCSGQMYKYEEKLPQEPSSSSFCDSTTISATFSAAGQTKIDDFEHLPGMKKLQEEEERVVAEIERHIVDALVLETVKTVAAFEGISVPF